jgi:multidrug resistance efflux pump
MGSVVALHAREGDKVRAGQLVIEIDARDARAQLQKAEAGLREAQQSLAEVDQSLRAGESASKAAAANRSLAAATYVRYQKLLERRSVSPQEFDEVETRHRVASAEAERAERMIEVLEAKRHQVLARIDQARADIDGARIFAGYARITSPINGVVAARQADLGQTASPGAPLLTVEDDVHYQIEAAVEESHIGAIRVGDKASALIDALGGDAIEGRVAEIIPSADPASRTFVVKVDLTTPAAGSVKLRSGLFARARFSLGTRQALMVPGRAVVTRGQLTGVFVVDDSGVSVLRLIKPGKTNKDRIEIQSGLKPGDQVIVSDVESLVDGTRVQRQSHE